MAAIDGPPSPTSAAGGNSADTDVDNVVIKVFDQGGKRNVVLKVHDHVEAGQLVGNLGAAFGAVARL